MFSIGYNKKIMRQPPVFILIPTPVAAGNTTIVIHASKPFRLTSWHLILD